ncbi:hypothetical protein ABH899_005432 [Paenibacillus sp. RC84]
MPQPLNPFCEKAKHRCFLSKVLVKTISQAADRRGFVRCLAAAVGDEVTRAEDARLARPHFRVDGDSVVFTLQSPFHEVSEITIISVTYDDFIHFDFIRRPGFRMGKRDPFDSISSAVQA